MKTYIKGIKTVAVIFLSLALFSCQEEQIVPIDTLSTSPDELMLKGPRTNLTVTLDADTFTNHCEGSTNTKQDLLWFADECPTTGKVCIAVEGNPCASEEDLDLQSISLNFNPKRGGPSYCRVIMTEGNKTYFGNWEYEDEHGDGFPELTKDRFSHNFIEPVTLFEKLKGNQGLSKIPFGEITIGEIVIE